MKSFIILTLLSLAAAASTTPADLVKKVSQALNAVQKHAGFLKAMNRGRRLNTEFNAEYTRFTCKSSVKGVIFGKCDTGSNIDSSSVFETGSQIIETDACGNFGGVYMKITYTGTNITLTVHEATDCSDTGTSRSVQSGVCLGTEYFKVFEGKAIYLEGGKKSDCSDATDPLGVGVYAVDGGCLPESSSYM